MINMQSPQQGASLARVRNASTWFYWIAGFSILRAFLNSSSHHASYSFYSMGFTNLLSTTSAGLIVSLIICGLWVVFGVFAGRGQKWAFITGIVLYLLDAVLLLVLGIIGSQPLPLIAVALHGYVIYRLVLGLQACGQLSAPSAPYGTGYYGAPAQPGAWPPPPGPQQIPPQYGASPYGQQPGGSPPQNPQYGASQYGQPQPGAYPPPAQPYGQNLDGSSTEPPASDWSQPAQPQALPSHWPAPAQPAPSRPVPENDQTSS